MPRLATRETPFSEMTGAVLCKRLARAAGVRRTSQKDENDLILVKVKRMGGEVRGAERRRSLSGESSRTGTSGHSQLRSRGKGETLAGTLGRDDASMVAWGGGGAGRAM